MIAHLSGTLLSKQATSAIVDVGGVGYDVAVPLSTFYELGEVGEPVQLRVYTHVREDTDSAFRIQNYTRARAISAIDFR
jgi:Holliday junction DNA helicase RuvA